MPDIKEKLVELMVGAFDKCCSMLCYKECEYYNKDEKAVERNCQGRLFADHLIANGVTIQQEQFREVTKMVGWISVEERLPKGCNGEDLSENVIAYLNNGEIAEVCTGWCNGDQWWLIVGDRDTHTSWGMGAVTHWMPLPEPPKG